MSVSKEEKKRQLLVVVTPDKNVFEEFMHHKAPNWRVDNVIWVKNRCDLNKIRGLELKFENIHFLHRSWEIKNAEPIIMASVRNYPVKET